MGLFGRSRKLCPVCGKPASRFLPTKVEGQPLCGDCGSKVLEVPGDLRDSVIANMASLREYLAVFEENQSLRDSFEETFRQEFGFFGGCIVLDVPRRLLRVSSSDNAFVYEPQNILNFRITEDDSPLFEGSKDELVCYESTVPARVRSLGPELDRYRIERRQYEQMEQMEKMLRKQAEQTGQSYSPNYYSEPDASCFNPFRKIYIHIELDHPYRKSNAEYKKGAPDFSNDNPSIQGYLTDYEALMQEMRALAENLMAVINPDAPRRQVAAQPEPGMRSMPDAPAAPMDAVAEIQKYKALLDSGAITDEEFTAKKRQLLGI